MKVHCRRNTCCYAIEKRVSGLKTGMKDLHICLKKTLFQTGHIKKRQLTDQKRDFELGQLHTFSVPSQKSKTSRSTDRLCPRPFGSLLELYIRWTRYLLYMYYSHATQRGILLQKSQLHKSTAGDSRIGWLLTSHISMVIFIS